MLKSSSFQVLLASVVPTPTEGNAMVGIQHSSIYDARCAYPNCARPARRPTSRPHSTSRPRKLSPTITASSYFPSSSWLATATTATTDRSRTTLSGSTKWLLIVTLAMVAFSSLLSFNTAVSTVEAAPMPAGPAHPSHCPDEGQCNFACQLHYYQGGVCLGPDDNVCVCHDLAPGH